MAQALAAEVLSVRRVSFAYSARGEHAARPVLEGVDLRIAEGEFVALLGTNGSGKTTLLRLMAGTLMPSRGEVALLGTPVAGLSRGEAARSIALLPQSLELPSGFRVRELVEMGRAPHASRLFGTTPRDRVAVEVALREAAAVDLADRRPAELSGGERQRVLVAMALAQEPRVLLLDEPTLHLDLAHQVALLEAVVRIQRSRGVTVIAVFHDLNLAAAFAPRIAVLDQGRIVADGAPDEVLTTDLVGRVFEVAVEEATTARGERFLALRRGEPTQLG